MNESGTPLGAGPEIISEQGCTLTSYVRMANALGANFDLAFANDFAKANQLFTGDNSDELTIANGVRLVNGLLGKAEITDISISYDSSSAGIDENIFSDYLTHENSDSKYFCNARIHTSNADQSKFYVHTVSVDFGALMSDNCSNQPTNLKIRDTSNVGRKQLYGDERVNNLLRIDFFKINSANNE